MPETVIQYRSADWHADAALLRRLREAVFVHEQGVPPEIEWDGQDESAVHVIAELAGEPVGCGRLLPGGKIGRMAVLAPHRGSGVGAGMLAWLVDAARAQGLPSVYLHAQAHALGFYERAGFAPEGEQFDEAGIAHLRMQQRLDYSAWNRDLAHVRYPTPFSDLVLSLVNSASRQVAILSPTLDAAVFDSEDLVSAMTALCRRTRQATVRILVADARPLVQNGHRLLALSRRLPSKILLQRLPEHPEWRSETVVIRDRDGLLMTGADPSGGGIFHAADRAGATQWLERFEDFWKYSAVDPEFRSMRL